MGPIFFKSLINTNSATFLSKKLIQPKFMKLMKIFSINFAKRLKSGPDSFHPNVKIVPYKKAMRICEQNFEKRIKEIISKLD